MCHCEERSDAAISGSAVAISPVAFPRCSRVLRDCHVGLRPPRNDKPLAFAILTMVCTSCRCTAGRGQPGPYNARLAASLNFTLRNIRHFQILAAVFGDIFLSSGEIIAEEEIKIERRFLRVLGMTLMRRRVSGVHRREPHHLRLVLAEALRARDGNLLSLERFQNVGLLRLVIGEPRLSLQVISNSGVSAI